MSRKVAFAGILTGIAAVLLYAGSVMPTGKLTFYFLASLPVALSILGFGTGTGAAVYFSACIVTALVSGNIYGIIPFALFFGHYPIWKFYIEKGRAAAVEVLLKLAVFNMSALLWYLLFKNLFVEVLPVGLVKNGFLLAGFIAVLQVAFFIYDYLLSRVLFFCESKMGLPGNNRKW